MLRFLALVWLLLVCRFAASAETFLILPFFNISKTANLDWVGESLSESLREALANEGVIAIDREDRREAYRRLSIRPNSQLARGTVYRYSEKLRPSGNKQTT